MVFLFTAAVFASAVLLFAVQPIAAKIALPLFGGTPAVWTTAMLLFQLLLLAGYAYAHLLTTRVPQKLQGWMHLGVLLVAGLALPIALPGRIEQWIVEGGELTAWRALLALAATAGGPFFAVSTLGPLLQRWFAMTSHPHAGDPYFLYAASNLGSMIGLLGYPFLIEPAAGLHAQGWWWTIGYAMLVPLIGVCALAATRSPRAGVVPLPVAAPEPLSHAQRLSWIALAFIASSLMLGVTLKLTTDVAAFPLLWVLPLSLYLLSFVVAFAQRRGDPARLPAMLWVLLGPAVAIALVGFTKLPAALSMPVHLGGLFIGAWLCHGRLAGTRPSPARLTEFYLLIAVGGALGGVFNALIAPVIFNDVWEYPIALAMVALAAVPTLATLSNKTAEKPDKKPALNTWALAIGLGLALAIALLMGGRFAVQRIAGFPTLLMLLPLVVLTLVLVALRLPRAWAIVLSVLFLVPQRSFTFLPRDRSRSFFGVHTVNTSPDGLRRIYAHGTTNHGMQRLDPGADPRDTGYYHLDGPLAQVFEHVKPQRFAIVGLGIGTLVAYGEPGTHTDLIEIDPEVVRIARNVDQFTFLRDARCSFEVIVGDGRLAIAAQPAASYDLIVADAFSSDAIPLHLITVEALQIYFDALKPDGVLLMNISNRYMVLDPVLAAAAEALGLHVRVRADSAIDPATGQRPPYRFPSKWAVLATDPQTLSPYNEASGWTTPGAPPGYRAWTDDRSNPLSVIRWW